MQQSGYKGVQALSSGIGYNGGFCRFYYVPKEWIDVWPSVNPQTQYLTTEPSLISGKSWLGPLKVPNNQLGYEEPLNKSGAGIFYKPKITGYHPGDSGISRINQENMPHHEFIVVGKQRAGGLFLIFGNKERGLDYTTDFTNGPGVKKIAGTEFSFTADALNKALVLPTFLGENVEPPSDGDGEGPATVPDPNQKEIIWFTDDDAYKDIAWNTTRKDRFGAFPEIQVWELKEPGGAQFINAPITVDQPPPDNTSFRVYLGGTDGFIIIM